MCTGSERVALVTGAARGIGFTVARHFLAAGVRVVAIDQDADALDLARRHLAAGEDRLLTLRCDVGDPDQVAPAVAAAAQAWRRLDAVVNNAGGGVVAAVADLTLAEWDRVLNVNLRAAWLTTRAALPWLRRAPGGGSVVNVASTRALMSEPDTIAYAASKAGLLGLTHALAVSLGPEVRVNAVSPGWIDVRAVPRPADEPPPEPYAPPHHRQHPAGRIGTPDDVARLVLHLCDPEASGFMTGQNLVLDGGMTRRMIYLDE
ncbi:MAG: SDR family oxidoreductase [Candidatus Krumholzibacteriia bacterium]